MVKPIDIEKRPQDATRDSRRNLEDLKNIEAGQTQSHKEQRAGMLETAAGAAGAYAQQGGHAGRRGQSSLFREMPRASGELLVGQRGQQDELRAQGAAQEEQIQHIQQKAQLDRYTQETQIKDREVALLNARAAFNYGMEAKQLIYSSNGALADYSFQVMAEDFERGRVTERELQAIVQASQRNMLQYEQHAETIMTQIQGHFEAGLNEQTVFHAKQLMDEYYEYQLKVAAEAAKAANTASILKGVFQIGGMVIGGVVGGPAGAAVGGAVGGAMGKIVGGGQ